MIISLIQIYSVVGLILGGLAINGSIKIDKDVSNFYLLVLLLEYILIWPYYLYLVTISYYYTFKAQRLINKLFLDQINFIYKGLKLRIWNPKSGNYLYCFGGDKQWVKFFKKNVYIVENIQLYSGYLDKNKEEIYEGDLIQEGSINDKIWGDTTYEAKILIAPIGEVKLMQDGESQGFNIVEVKSGEVEYPNGDKDELIFSNFDGWYFWGDEDNVEVVGNIFEGSKK